MTFDRVGTGFGVCPHCWHVNGPHSRICLGCRADMTLVLQESGGERWSAPAQSPMPSRVASRLSRPRRALLFGFVMLFAIAQLVSVFAPRTVFAPAPAESPGR